jgi:tRNA pseudouridine55 synthase
MSRSTPAVVRPVDSPDGLVVVDKPGGFTSHDVVATMRGIARTRRVGHAGTLDPLATGVLVLGLGKATRLLGHLALTEKEYTGTSRLALTTVTDDAEGELITAGGANGLDRPSIERAAAELTGDIMQVPAQVSAVKIDGKRSYARVRAGENVEIPARPVRVSLFTVHDIVPRTAEDGTSVIDLEVRVVCSSGTYIRALARDMGVSLGTGGHLTALRRTRVGPYGLDGARTLDQLRQGLAVLPLGAAAAAAFPRWEVDEDQAKLLGNGARIDTPQLPAGPVAVFGPEERFIALIEVTQTETGPRSRSLAVFS